MIVKTIKQMTQINTGDEKRIQHALKVHSFCKEIGKQENLSTDEMLILETSAILHDIGIKQCESKYQNSSGQLQQVEGPPIAKKLLQKQNVNEDFINDVCFLIANHHTYHNVQTNEHQILLESDLIVNMIENNITKNALLKALKSIFKTKSGIRIAKKYIDQRSDNKN